MRQQPLQNTVERLRKQLLEMEGRTKPLHDTSTKLGLPFLERHFPNHSFPTGTIHEFVSTKPEHTACTSAFILALLAKLEGSTGMYVWIGKQRQIFAPSLPVFGILPQQLIFINLSKPRDILWATEEALKCKSLNGVISEVEGITFAQSQRLQLTVEKSGVTGFMLRTNAEHITATACAARWLITPIMSENEDELPGIGFARWQIALLKVRNGNTASFNMGWRNGQFYTAKKRAMPLSLSQAGGS
ncbi:ImuA family protein [Pedobacter sp. SL55]|uniref:ImuA family protein n=1 Tax=Pedobacter sp. SL55 TaxID=2995161 RepID=UPI00226D7419|nr:Error-prone repair protein ImuA [Pedobacter sp. SL55]WAC42532.1 Error-prone repair protein ImuA [Pedobacter sp. SL55]